MDYLLGYKKGMTQVYDDRKAIPVTVVEVPQNTVYAVSKGTEDLSRVDIGIGRKRKPSKAERGKYSGVKDVVPTNIWTVHSGDGGLSAGKTFGAEICSPGETITISGVTKAKGFAGVVKRWGFAGGKRTHGQSDRERAPGSIGGGTDPGRVYPGKKMPGRMGGGTKTLYGREIIGMGDGYILVKGSLPGNIGGLLKIEREHQDEN